jgi:hypothetical protein
MGILSRRRLLLGAGAASLAALGGPLTAAAQENDPLPSWNDGAAKKAIIKLVTTTTTAGSANFVPEGARVATFDQDGTTWVEHPVYTELAFTLDRVRDLASSHPNWATTPPFNAVLNNNTSAIAAFSKADWEKIIAVTHVGMPVGQFAATTAAWIAKARDPRWHKPYTDLVYQPMLEAMRYLRAHGYRTYIVTGGTQPFVRAYAQQTYGIPPEQIIGTAFGSQFTNSGGGDILLLAPKLLLDNNFSGKAEDIYLFTGQHPQIAFGNTSGDAEMLEYAQAGGKASAAFLVLHDDATREYAYGPASGLPDTKIGTFSQALYDKAKARGWHIISMKTDWNRIFS